MLALANTYLSHFHHAVRLHQTIGEFVLCLHVILACTNSIWNVGHSASADLWNVNTLRGAECFPLTSSKKSWAVELQMTLRVCVYTTRLKAWVFPPFSVLKDTWWECKISSCHASASTLLSICWIHTKTSVAQSAITKKLLADMIDNDWRWVINQFIYPFK